MNRGKCAAKLVGVGLGEILEIVFATHRRNVGDRATFLDLHKASRANDVEGQPPVA